MLLNSAFSCKDSEIQAHKESLFRFALWRVRNEFAAQDLVQETFLAAVKAPDRFRGDSRLLTWLVGILRHKISDYFRQQGRERPLLLDRPSTDGDDELYGLAVQGPSDVEDSGHSPNRRLELIEFRNALDLALSKLPSLAAKVFQLYEIEGEPGAVVCTRLQISPENLWVLLHRARKKLRAELSPWRTDDT